MIAPDIELIMKAPVRYMPETWKCFTDYLPRNLKYKQCLYAFTPKAANDNELFMCIQPLNTEWENAYKTPNTSGTYAEGYNALGMGEPSYCQFDVAQDWDCWSLVYNEADHCPFISGIWMPNGVDNAPLIWIYPSVDLNNGWLHDGQTIYFTPFCMSINGNTSITIYEYEHDSMAAFEKDPDAMLVKTLEIPLGGGNNGLVNDGFRWSIQLIPLGKDGFCLMADINGERINKTYWSSIRRENIPLLGGGSKGVVYATAGASQVSFGSLKFLPTPAYASVVSEMYTKPDLDDSMPTLDISSYCPPGTSITYDLIDAYGNVIQQFRYGTVFQYFWYRINMFSTTVKHTPVIFDVRVNFEGLLDDYVNTGIDISADVISISEKSGFEVGDFSGNITLRNQNDKYTSLLGRVMHQMNYSVGGVARAVLYTNNMDMDWYKSPSDENLIVSWEAGDGWTRLKQNKTYNFPPWDGQILSDAMEDYMKRLGWPADKIDIEAIDFTVPEKRGGTDFALKPEDGQGADDFLKEIHSKFISTYVMRFTGDGTFEVKKPTTAVVARTFYSSRLDAADDYYLFDGAKLTWVYEDYRNEVWVMGYDKAAEKVALAVYVDLASQNDPYYPYYVGERRLVQMVTPFPQAVCEAICLETVKWVCQPQHNIQFRTKLDPLLKPGDFIQIYPYDILYRITNIDVDASPTNVSFRDGSLLGCNITCTSWPVAY